MSLVKVNISRINSAEKSTVYNYRLLGRIPQREGNTSSVRMNISRINSLGNIIGITTTFLLGRTPRMRIFVIG